MITHQHLDHLGLVDILARRSGAEVCALDLLAPVIEDFAEHAERDDELAEALMLRHGIPPDVVTALRAVSRMARGWGGSTAVTRRLDDGERLEFAGRAFEVLHRPGHSPSDTVFFDARGRHAGGRRPPDQAHLLQPAHLQAARRHRRRDERPRALLTYMASLRDDARDGDRDGAARATATRSATTRR